MRIFESDEVVNFVDETNILVGYRLDQCCCEHADWFIAPKITPYSSSNDDYPELPDVSTYTFDKEFHEYVDSDALDAGAMIVFRLVSEGKSNLYLHLFNAHNGYYSHGFWIEVDGETVEEDSL